MTTEVFYFLPPARASGQHREVHSYGPSASRFNTDFSLEIAPAAISNFFLLAIVQGRVRVIPDTRTVSPIPCTLLLQPSQAPFNDLVATLGGNVIFIYRNLDSNSVRSLFEPRIDEAARSAGFLRESTLSDRLDHFMRGNFWIDVEAGNEIGLACTVGGEGGWSRFGFEIAFMPNIAMTRDGSTWDTTGTGWRRVQQLVQQDNVSTRRLDPIAFYALIPHAPRLNLISTHLDHFLRTLPTQRTLLELRDEYDRPFVGQIGVEHGGTNRAVSFDAASRGHAVLSTRTSGAPNPDGEYRLVWANHVFTELPSGSHASATPSKRLINPAHWALQAIFMADQDDDASWFMANTNPLPRFTANNRITFLIDGWPTYAEMVRAIRSVTAPGHYLYFAGWYLGDDFEMIHGDEDSTFARLTEEIAGEPSPSAASSPQVRALLWDFYGIVSSQNNAEAEHINALPNGRGRAIVDNDTATLGTHHQKLMIVNGASGAIAFCGGVDINPDRQDDQRHRVPSPYHDIHAKVEGPAVADLHLTFVQRWNNHSSRPEPLLTDPPPFQPNAGHQYVQVTRTYPRSMRYPYAPDGDNGTLRALLRAIRRARRYIYIEDQYLVPYAGGLPYDPDRDDTGIVRELRRALDQPSFEYILILIPNHSDLPEARFRRHRFIEALRAGHPSKVHVFYLTRSVRGSRRVVAPSPTSVASNVSGAMWAVIEGLIDRAAVNIGVNAASGSSTFPDEVYVHSKVWIIDDVYAKIGSANLNRRGMTHDSEVDIHVIDGAIHNGGRAFARRFRMALWGEHLGMQGVVLNSLLEDPTYALNFWVHPTSAPTRVRRYQADTEHNCNAPINLECRDGLWNRVLDPLDL